MNRRAARSEPKRPALAREPTARVRGRGLFGALLALAASVAAAAEPVTVRVTTVIDGDTFSFQGPSNLEYRVDVAGIDAPELEQAYGSEAKRALSDRVLGQEVQILIVARSAAERLTAQVTAAGRALAPELLRAGAAWCASDGKVPADLRAAEAAARAAGVGLWQSEDPLPPWQWRRRDRTAPDRVREHEPSQNSDPVYITPSGRKFHRRNCPRIRDEAKAVTRRQAEKWGYKPCTVCKP